MGTYSLNVYAEMYLDGGADRRTDLDEGPVDGITDKVGVGSRRSCCV